jgi:uncharacterized membrane protein YeaQ/YmgE (transglycosylase-associated protein family)
MIGFMAGLLSGKLVEPRALIAQWDVLFGVSGALGGGFLFDAFGVGHYGFWGSVGMATLGSFVLLAFVNFSRWWARGAGAPVNKL